MWTPKTKYVHSTPGTTRGPRRPREDHVIMESEIGLYDYKPSNARGYQKVEGARKDPLLELLERDWYC